MYKSASATDKGTLKQLEVLINRRNVPSVVKRNFSATRDFMNVVLDAHLIVAALNFFGMDSAGDKPTKKAPRDADLLSDDSKRKYLQSVLGEFVDKFVLNHTIDAESMTSGKPEKPRSSVKKSVKKPHDFVFNYACAILTYGLMARNFQDSSREGDGERTLRCYKFLLLHFKASSHSKYATEAYHLVTQVKALLSPRRAHQLVWNRTCNPKGGDGNNVELDLHQEHLNRVFKDDINTFRANITDASIKRSGNAIGPISAFLQSVDKQLNVRSPSGRHAMPSTKADMDLIIKCLCKQEVFLNIPNRCHSTFATFSNNPFVSLQNNPKKLHSWLKTKRAQYARKKDIASLLY